MASKSVAVALFAALSLVAFSGNALSQSATPAAKPQPAISDDSVDDFSELDKNLADLQRAIDRADRLVKEDEASMMPKEHLDAFRKTVAELLTSLSDHGEIALMGQSALNFVSQKLAEARQDTHFSPAQRQELLTRWGRLEAETRTAVQRLDAIRAELTGKLRTLQADRDFIDRLEELKQARAVIDAISDLADQRQAVSERLTDLLQSRAKGM